MAVLIWTTVTAKKDCNADPRCQSFSEDALSWHWVAAIAIVGVFGLFMAFTIFCRFGMYVLKNQTTIESLDFGTPRTSVAIKIEEWELQQIPPEKGYMFTTFPLSTSRKPPSSRLVESNGKAVNADDGQTEKPAEHQEQDAEPSDPPETSTTTQSETESPPLRHNQKQILPPSSYAIFVIILLPAGINIWDVGILNNIRSAMGNRVIDWFLPFKMSPCIEEHNPGDDISEYKLGKGYYEMEKAALPHRYDDQGKRKEPLYPEERRRRRSSHRRRRRRTSTGEV
jgi:hypothetical protein